MKKLVLALAVAAAALCACTKAENPTGEGRKAVKFTVENLGTFTLRSATLGIGESGCSNVGIYAADLGANNVQATVSGSALTPASPIYWGVGQTISTQFVARYPYYDGATIDGAYTIPANQQSSDEFSYHANFMSAVQSASPDPGTVAFNFTHPFAKVVVNVTNNLSADAVASVVLESVKQTATTLNLTTAPATPTLSDATVNVTACNTAANSYSMIIMPQAATASMNIVVTTLLGSVYTFRITNADYNFLAGKIATAAVTLDPIGGGSNNRVQVGAMSFTTTDWSDGAATTIDTVGDPTLGAYMQIGGTLFTDDDADAVEAGTLNAWGKWYNMTYSAENTWTITVNYRESMADDEGGKGFLIRTSNETTYYKMYNGSDNIGSDPYELYPENGTHSKNVRLESASGKFTITFNSSNNEVSVAAAL